MIYQILLWAGVPASVIVILWGASRLFGSRTARENRRARKLYRRALRALGWVEGGFYPYFEKRYVTLLRRAAIRNHSGAQYVLGVAYREGTGVPQSEGDAIDWFFVSAGQGYALAQFALGLSYKDGEGVPQSEARAIHWLTKAADQGHPGANRWLDALQVGDGESEPFQAPFEPELIDARRRLICFRDLE